MTHPTEQLNAALAGRYLVERLVGEGGMATVYLARDVKHDRNVALKVLKPELGAVLGVDRFLSEIKVTANLQHPNLLPLFDSGEAAGLLFYVMPFIEGESLRARLEREKQLPMDEAVRLAVAIASALDYAHRHGVIHRDLKPENILLHDGQPVIADFGIALAVSKAGGARVTQTGLSLGTPQYMSPEQASGDRAIDARSDIYSLAAVTYEMIAGEAPHTGSTAQAIMAKLMTAEPAPLSQLRKSAPVHVEAAVERALAKLPADRFSTAKEFADALQGGGFTLSARTTSRTAQGTRNAKPLVRHPAFIGLAIVALLAIGLAVQQWRRAQAAELAMPVVRFQVAIPPSTLTNSSTAGNNLAVSPDGKTVAYISLDDRGVARVYLRSLDSFDARPIAGTEGAQQPFFSPDGSQVGYVSNGAVFKVALTGGAPISLGATVNAPVGLTWSSAGVIVAGTARGLVVVPDNGGPSRMLATADTARGELYFNQVVALDDGETVLFAVQPKGGILRTHLAAVSAKTGVVKRFETAVLSPLGVQDGQLVFVAPNGTLSTVPFDVRKLAVTGQPSALGTTVLVRASGAADAALSRSGTLVYQSAVAESQVGWVDDRGVFTPIGGETRPYIYPRLSPDAKRIALTVGSGNRSDVWIYDIASSTPARLTTEGTINERPEWSSDGTRVLYRSDRGERTGMWWQPADRSGSAEALQASGKHDFYEAVMAPGGKTMVYQIDDAGATAADLMWRGFADDTTSKVIMNTKFTETEPRISPDGKWVAFVTDASGTTQVVVQPLPGPGAQLQVSVNGGSEPVWSRDGKHLYYRDGRKLVDASVATTPSLSVTKRTMLFDDTYVSAPAPHANYDVAPDGRFVMVRNAQSAQLTVVFGWRAEMRGRLRGSR